MSTCKYETGYYQEYPHLIRASKQLFNDRHQEAVERKERLESFIAAKEKEFHANGTRGAFQRADAIREFNENEA